MIYSRNKHMQRQPRIFIGLIEIAGHCYNLAKGFRELGCNVTFVDLTSNPNAYGSMDNHNGFLRFMQWIADHRKRSSKRRIDGFFWRSFQTILRPALFLYALCRHDIFILGHNTSFLGFWDLPILRALGKTIVYQFYGSDGRPRFMDGFFLSFPQAKNIRWLVRMVRRQRRMIRRIERWANVVISIGPQSHFQRRPFVQWLRVGFAAQPPKRTSQRDTTVASNRPIRILHCPSNPISKGTESLRRMIDEISRTHSIQWVEVIAQSNETVCNELEKCDFVVDQLYADYGMAGFATEAAWFGKPSVVGGYAVDSWLRELPASEHPPSLYCRPSELPGAIVKLIEDEEFRIRLGQKANEFVRTRWSPRDIAQKTLQLIEGNIPREWFCQPENITYCAGCGLSHEQLRETLQKMIHQCGAKALCLEDKPFLEHTLIQFANGEPFPPEAG